MAYTQEDLALAVSHVRKGEAHIRALEENILYFREQGYNTDLPASVLAVFKDVLAEMHEHETAIRADILRQGKKLSPT
ncbi:MAG: hypothetical protein JO111_13255 [Caulobacteraceae bacterium]|nr:hypothetical protein [Caulobacteraceae bacterium]